MVERFLFNWIDAKSAGAAIRGQNNLIILPPSNKTKAALPFPQFAEPGTNIALNSTIIERMPIPAWHGIGEGLVSLRVCYCHSNTLSLLVFTRKLQSVFEANDGITSSGYTVPQLILDNREAPIP
jgi:hypothetical protein